MRKTTLGSSFILIRQHILKTGYGQSHITGCRYYCTTPDPLSLFRNEAQAQLDLVRRMEKISVNCVGVLGVDGREPKLLMNKNVSTPYYCTKHLGEPYMSQSALALVNGEEWSMHKPLVDDCDLQLLNFQHDDPSVVNQAFWRTCTLILAAVLQRAFKPQCELLLHRPLDFKVSSGSFAYDFSARFDGAWSPSQEELSTISRMATKLSYGLSRNPTYYYIQPLRISIERAKAMFRSNRYKLKHLEDLKATQDDVNVYRLGTHIDVMEKSVISNVNLLGRFNVTAIHKLGEEDGGRSIYRAQGVALPKSITMHSWTYDLLMKNALQLNDSEEISEDEKKSEEESENVFIAATGSK